MQLASTDLMGGQEPLTIGGQGILANPNSRYGRNLNSLQGRLDIQRSIETPTTFFTNDPRFAIVTARQSPAMLTGGQSVENSAALRQSQIIERRNIRLGSNVTNEQSTAITIRSSLAIEKHRHVRQANALLSQKFVKLPEAFKHLRSLGPLDNNAKM